MRQQQTDSERPGDRQAHPSAQVETRGRETTGPSVPGDSPALAAARVECSDVVKRLNRELENLQAIENRLAAAAKDAEPVASPAGHDLHRLTREAWFAGGGPELARGHISEAIGILRFTCEEDQRKSILDFFGETIESSPRGTR